MNTSDANERTPDINQTITSLYRAVLLREPEDGAIDYWGSTLERHGIAFVLNQFLRSAEFAGKIGQFVDLYPFDQAPAQTIETTIDAETMARLWDRVSRIWTKLGHDDPYFSVLSDPRWHGLSESDRIEAFYLTGAGDLQRLEAWLSRNKLSVASDGSADLRNGWLRSTMP